MRYSRQLKLPELGLAGQEKLQQASVLIVGVGGLGCPAAQYLAAAGVGRIGLLDGDQVEASNLHRQVLFLEDDLGRNKAEAAQEHLSRQNSHIKIEAYPEHLSASNAMNYFQAFDIVMDGTDSFTSKYLINDAALKSGKPWVYASIYKYEGQLSVFNYQNGPSLRCLFSNPPWKEIRCEITGVLGVLPGIMGVKQAAEVLKIILGLGKVSAGKLKLYHLLDDEVQELRISRNAEQIKRVMDKPLEEEKMHCEFAHTHFTYLDVREPEEMPKGLAPHILTIPLSELRNRQKEIPFDRDIYVFCQSGKRSREAIHLLQKEFGFRNLIQVEGGIFALQNGR
ncbi:MAG: molybdenum cofactor biosynthesis protein [Bacteroidetes bacterium]|nr:molybdenum cofactor biosynthesis protein [Bacteroidota bacterium]